MRFIYKLSITVVFLLIVGNLVAIDYFLIKSNRLTPFTGKPLVKEPSEIEPAIGCDSDCQGIIADKTASEVARLAVEWEKKLVIPSPRVINQVTKTNNEPKMVVIPITSYGETASTSWVEISPSEFYFDLENYPGAKKVVFEAYLLAEHGGSKIYARLYDKTNFRGVDNSDIQTNTENYFRIESATVSIWRGNNKYSIQLKSENGTLAKIKDAKIVISY